MTDLDDSELISLFRTSNSKHYAFNMIVRKYQKRLYWHVRRILVSHEDADDVVQNTFVKAWEGLGQFRGESKIFTWLYRIATNEALSFLKQRNRFSFFPLAESGKELAEKLAADVYFEGDEIRLKLQKALMSLPPKQRAVFNMKYFDEMKYEEMSEVMETSVGALKASYYHAVRKIENYLKSH